MTLSSPIALIVSFFSSGGLQRLALVGGLIALPSALLMWLAIRWLDRRKAWGAARERGRIAWW